jgi:hypothetical protein
LFLLPFSWISLQGFPYFNREEIYKRTYDYYLWQILWYGQKGEQHAWRRCWKTRWAERCWRSGWTPPRGPARSCAPLHQLSGSMLAAAAGAATAAAGNSSEYGRSIPDHRPLERMRVKLKIT